MTSRRTLIPTSAAALLALALSQVATAAAPTPPPGAEEPMVTIFAGSREEASKARVALTGLFERVAASLWTTSAPPSDLVTVIPHDAGRKRGDWAVQVRLPEGVTLRQFVDALANDQVCKDSRTGCGERCASVNAAAGEGHWHLTPEEGMRACLVAFMGQPAAGSEVETLVTQHPSEYGFDRKPRTERVRITLGRPDFSPSFGTGK
jgi:hypothetical protein